MPDGEWVSEPGECDTVPFGASTGVRETLVGPKAFCMGDATSYNCAEQAMKFWAAGRFSSQPFVRRRAVSVGAPKNKAQSFEEAVPIEVTGVADAAVGCGEAVGPLGGTAALGGGQLLAEARCAWAPVGLPPDP